MAEAVEGAQENTEEIQPTQAETSAPAESSSDFRKAFESVSNPQPEEEAEPEPPAQEAAPKQYSAEEVRALVSEMLTESQGDLQKQLRDHSGKIGGLFRKFEQFGATAKSAAAPGKLTPESLKRMKAQFPELAEVLQEDLAEIFTAQPETEKPQQEAKPGAYSAEEVTTILNELHPDWAELRDQKPQDYQDWLASLRPSTRARFLSSSDPYHVAEKLDEFKEWRESQKKEEPPPAAPEKTARLENAVPPTTGVKPPVKGEPTPSESFRNGWKRAAGSRF